ncbi:hypothetical protein [Schinkia azotoformans]|uniref:hypothetical protein n=1 Tax=Schinkia azotoformans TaxID=1454 RepID=UPI002DBCC242|nr:hypothetical protein [Schinkia azotoformans]MEC1744139.1 hypothetical protein [Schinkia azotoformans]
MPLPLLIAKQENQKICPDDYKLGWLFKNDKETYWMIWGSSKNKESALKVAKEVIEKQGERDVFISDIHLSKHPTLEQVSALKQVQI